MSSPIPDYEVLLEYEKTKRGNRSNTSLLQFADAFCEIENRKLQLELIALDMEIRFQLGDQAQPEDYFLEFPHLIKAIEALHKEVLQHHVNSFCPLKFQFGKLPISFDRYHVESEIDRGAMGVVYHAVDKESGHDCALKILFFNRSSILEEARILLQLDHPSINRIHCFGVCEKLPFMSTFKVDGVNLKSVISRNRIVPANQAVRIVSKLAFIFQQIHEFGIIHQDIKPSNIMIQTTGEPIAIDFGIANEIEDGCLVRAGGSIEYLAPEIIDTCFGLPGATSDIYSLGVVLYELLTGVRPYRMRGSNMLEQLKTYPPCRPTDFGIDAIDDELERICLSAIKKSVIDRTETMEKFHQQLQAWIANNSDAQHTRRCG